MRDLDETDLEILALLAENARRPFSDIGDVIGLSGPAVSDRVTRLQDAGVINNFTIDVDQGQLRAGVPVFIQAEVPAESLDTARSSVQDSENVEHVFLTAEGGLWFYARVDGQNIRAWVEGLFAETPLTDYTVTLIDKTEWTPSVEGMGFALTCAECENTVDSEGETARIDDEIYHFCCPSCLARFEDRYRRIEAGA